jgi:hypothetical protein
MPVFEHDRAPNQFAVDIARSSCRHARDCQEDRDTAIDAEQEAGLLIGRHLAATNGLNFLGIFMLDRSLASGVNELWAASGED